MLCVLRQSGKRGLIQIRDATAHRQRGAGDAEALLFLFETDGSLCAEFGWRVSGGLQTKSQCHREAPRVSGGDEFLRIGAFFIFESPVK